MFLSKFFNKTPSLDVFFTDEKRTNKNIKYETPGSSGADIRANETVTIKPNSWEIVSTGIMVNIPSEDYEIQIRSRSGLAAKKGIFVLNSPGTVDSDYLGELKVILYNLGKEDFVVIEGDRIAQIVVCKVSKANFLPRFTSNKRETSRGSGGFGSTGSG